MSALTLAEARRQARQMAAQAPEDEFASRAEAVRVLSQELERRRSEATNLFADTLRQFDTLIERVLALPEDVAAEREVLLAEIRERRAWVYARMREVNPDQAWFWTEEWQRGERQADRDIAAGKAHRFETDEEFFTYLEQIPYAHP